MVIGRYGTYAGRAVSERSGSTVVPCRTGAIDVTPAWSWNRSPTTGFDAFAVSCGVLVQTASPFHSRRRSSHPCHAVFPRKPLPRFMRPLSSGRNRVPRESVPGRRRPVRRGVMPPPW